MINITHKIFSLRKAVAQAVLTVSSQQTIDAIEQHRVPKGDVFEFSRAAGLLAVKKTSDVIPDCHPMPIEFTSITHQIDGLRIVVKTEVHTIYKTGVEVEAMHGASIAALTMYDMLKPLDKNIEISSVRLLQKQGGKSDYASNFSGSLRSTVQVCSDSISQGTGQDSAGKAIAAKLSSLNVETSLQEVIADDFDIIQNKATQLSQEGYDLVIFCGGTGLSGRDVTPDAIQPILHREIPGIMEAARSYGQQRTPYAMLSRGVAGFINHTLILTLPGSTKAAIESMDALFPYLLHVFQVAKGMRHDGPDRDKTATI